MDNNTRWRPHLAPFDVDPQPSQPVQRTEPDRSWMPKPTTATGGVDWHKNGGARRAWAPAVAWAAAHEPNFFAKLQKAEATLVGLEATVKHFDPRLQPARHDVSRHYAMLGKLHDNHVRSLPLVRY